MQALLLLLKGQKWNKQERFQGGAVAAWLCKGRPQSYLSPLIIIWGQTSIICANTEKDSEAFEKQQWGK